jgi:hypothetical protein
VRLVEHATPAASEHRCLCVPSSHYADAYALAAHVLIYQGDPEAALRRTQKLSTATRSIRSFTTTIAATRTTCGNRNFRPARGYLVAVHSELGRQREAVSEMATLRTMGERSSDRILPYGDPVIKRHILELWQAAERDA